MKNYQSIRNQPMDLNLDRDYMTEREIREMKRQARFENNAGSLESLSEAYVTEHTVIDFPL